MAAKRAARKASAARAPRGGLTRLGRTSHKFTTRQRRFIDEYAVDGNATQAAIRAGYTQRAATEAGYELLTNPHVAARIAANEKARSERVNFTADDALRKLVPLTDTNIKNFIVPSDDGKSAHLVTLEGILTLGDDIAVQISSVKQTTRFDTFGNQVIDVEFKLHDRIKAITQAGKHRAVRAWTEQVEHTHSLADHMRRIRGEEG